jgi:glycosyltransferase involved in cell wall biosynthesis
MNILVVHNLYRQPGGEDRVVENESALLARHGHKVVHYTADNDAIDRINPIALAGMTVWNHGSYRAVRDILAREAIDVMHVHNTLPLASPSVYYAAAAEGVPVVQTLHNYRLLCPNSLLFRDGHACTDCSTSRTSMPAVKHACYRGSRAATTAIAAMLWVHRAAGTWENHVDAYIAPSEFARKMFAAGGLPEERLHVKPHFVDGDPDAGRGGGGYALFAGRLSAEKGIETLLQAWEQLHTQIPLVIAGDGPLAPMVTDAAARLPGIRWVGRQSREALNSLMRRAELLVFPSVVFETFGQTIIEAYAAGTPVAASSGGAGAELVTPGRTGFLFQPGDAPDLARRTVEWLNQPWRMAAMRAAARTAYETRYTGDANYRQLMDIYERASQAAVVTKVSWGKRPEAVEVFRGAIFPQAKT